MNRMANIQLTICQWGNKHLAIIQYPACTKGDTDGALMEHHKPSDSSSDATVQHSIGEIA